VTPLWRDSSDGRFLLPHPKMLPKIVRLSLAAGQPGRLVLHTGAFWLLLALRDAIPRPQPLAIAEFPTLRLRLIKIAARITESATRVRMAFAAACPEAALFTGLARSLQPAGP
jgi:hypothetical protein